MFRSRLVMDLLAARMVDDDEHEVRSGILQNGRNKLKRINLKRQLLGFKIFTMNKRHTASSSD